MCDSRIVCRENTSILAVTELRMTKLGPSVCELSRNQASKCGVTKLQRESLYQFLVPNISITCRASALSIDFENATAPNFKSSPSEVRLNWKTYSAPSSIRP